MGEIREVVEAALASIQSDVSRALELSITTATAAQAGLRLATTEPHLLDAQEQFAALAQEINLVTELTLEVKSGLSFRIQTIRRAVLAGFAAFGEGRTIMLGSPSGGPDDGRYYERTLQTLSAHIGELEQRVAGTRVERDQTIERLRGLARLK